MAMLFISNQCLPLSLPAAPSRASSKLIQLPHATRIRFPGDQLRRKTKRLSVVTAAAPSSSVYVFAFLFPLSLLAVTIFTALKIGDKLDKDYLEELALNQAIMEADEDVDEEDRDISEDFGTSTEDKSALRSRNRPKREVY